MNKVILKSDDLDGYLTDYDRDNLERVRAYYNQVEKIAAEAESCGCMDAEKRSRLIQLYSAMGSLMKELLKNEPAVRVYSFDRPREVHGEASRLIYKLRDVNTDNHEFVYYIQRAYELLFNQAFAVGDLALGNHLVVKTPVTKPFQNYAVHRIPGIDSLVENTVMCVMLRGALLPSMIMSKEIQEYSSSAYVTPFALFSIKRDDTKMEKNMEYVLDLEKSYFNIDELNGRDLIFADPMNATGGSLVTIVKYLQSRGVKPASIKFFNVISALKGALRTVRALEDVTVYTLWMDPVLNDYAYILPGLGDAGDRLNGSDEPGSPRNIIQLIADYGAGIISLYRAQVRKIEETVLGR
jgi:uracil phosphoribosyltransferase